VRGDFLWDFH